MDTTNDRHDPGYAPSIEPRITRRLVLVGPHASARRTLFRRLILGMGSPGARALQGGPLARGCFEIDRQTHEIVDLPEWRVDQLAEGYAKGAIIAICIDPMRSNAESVVAPYVKRLRSSVWASHCVVLISESGHLPELMEQHWQSFLDSQGAPTRSYRVNCGDRRSPELFAKLLMLVE